MNEIQIFRHDEFGKIRTIEIDSEIYFVGTDVARTLGYAKPSNALHRHVDEEDRKILNVNTAPFQGSNTITLQNGISGRGNPNVTIINKSGLYSLVLASKLDVSKKFLR